jgi:hypothetical protein
MAIDMAAPYVPWSGSCRVTAEAGECGSAR